MSADAATEHDILAAYRFLLNREADPAGLQHYLKLAGDGLTVAALRQAMLASPEYVASRASVAPVKVALAENLFVSVDGSDPDFGRAIAHDRTWEPHIVEKIVSNLAPGDTFIDVGGNVGIMSFHAARAVGPAGRVIAFEPNPNNTARFIEGIALNGFSHVLLLQLALSSEPAIVALSGGSNTFVDVNKARGSVQAVRGDDLLAGQERIDFIKLDIEGYEPFALRGLSRTLARHRPKVLCEFNPRCLKAHANYRPADFADELFGLTASLEALEHDGTPHKLASPAALMELWEAENALAVRRNRLPDGMLHFDLFFGPEL